MKQTHLKIVQGTPFRFIFNVKQKNDAGELEVMPLTGCRIRLQARPSIASPEVLLDLSDGSGIDVDYEGGVGTIDMSAAETSALKWPYSPQKPVYQCEITPPDGEVIRILQGTITLDREVVRDG